MPITIDQFEDAPEEVFTFSEGSQPYRVMHFLAEHPDQAFTQTEIHEATGINRNSVGVVLSRLDDRGLVRHKGRYWAIGEDDRLAAYAAQQAASSVSVTDDYYGESGE